MSYNSLFGLGTHSADADLQGWWKLDDNASDTVVTDYSGNGNDGVAGANTDTLQAGSGPPWQSSGFTFPLNEVVTITDPLIFDGTNPLTVCCWTRVPNGDNANIFLGRSGGNTVARTRSDQVEFLLNLLGTNDRVRSTSTLPDDTWVPYAASWGGVGGDIGSSVGGEPFNTLPTSGSNNNYGGMRIGSSSLADVSNCSYFTRVLASSEVAEAAEGPEPLSLTAPTVSGTHETGQTLTTTNGTWDNQANGVIAYTYQWQRADDASGTNAADISGATSSTYTLTASDENKYVRSIVVASNDGGSDSAEDQSTAWTLVTAGGGGPTFQPAWAMNATVIIQQGLQ